MGNYHPHGDSSIYDTLVRLAQPWSLRYPLIDGQGNFGSPGNDPAAAMRYTECRLTPLAMEMLRDIDEETVDFIAELRRQDHGADDPAGPDSRTCWSTARRGHRGRHGHQHPAAQPARGRRRRAVVRWTTRTRPTRRLLDALMERIKGPDFPTGGLIVGRDGIEDAYRTGRGSIRMRAVVEVEEDAKGRTILVVTELPYQVNPDNLVESIAELVKDGKIAGIADIDDESSDRIGMRIVITLKRDAVAKVVLNNLYKHTQLQTPSAPTCWRSSTACRARCASTSSSATTSRTRSRSSSGAPSTGCARPRSAPTSCAACVKALDPLDEVIALIRALAVGRGRPRPA